MRAVNPFLVLGVDEAASRAEIDAAHRRLIVQHHPDRFATAGVEEQQRAVARAVEINEAHLLLTDPDYAARHKRTFDRVRAAGIPVEPAPQRRPEDAVPRAPAPTPGAGPRNAVGGGTPATPWVAPRRRRRFGRR